MGGVLALGWACQDLRFKVATWPPEPGRTPVVGYQEALGGPAAVAAWAVARLGGKALLISRRGRDRAGEWLEATLQAAGVVAAFTLGEATGVSAVLVAPDGERFIFPYRGRLPEEPEDDLLLWPEWVSVVLADTRWPGAAERVFERARDLGLPRVLDLDSVDEASLRLGRLASHVVASEGAAVEAGGLDHLQGLFSGAFVAVTLGEKGVVWPGGRIGALAVTPKDTTGAGDVFHGAFALALAKGMREEEALALANAVAGVYVAKGEIPDWQEALKWMQP
ncbi:PfkB family carbohydrate kinase [Thermus sediminis]|uniref:PfkB family carbohydrate kinase n=1 Tax=Thermus sediminis TaxID=1761908 RepID=UPI000E3C7F16|nr:PfkB family carbohydrate kinase [Thermus sediminis]